MPPKENVQIAKDGLTATLVSYLSEYSISLVLLGYFAIAYYLPVFKAPIAQCLHLRLSGETKIFFALLLFCLLQPIGAFITMTSWVALGWMERFEESFHFERNWFLSKGIKDYLGFTSIVDKMSLTRQNFYDTAREKEHLLTVREPEKLNVADYALGTSVFVRNLSFSVLILAVVHFASGQGWIGVGMLLLFAALTIINSAAAFYYSVYVLNVWINR